MEARLKFPYKCEPLKEFPGKWKTMKSVNVITDSAVLRAPTEFAKFAEDIYNFKVRPDDVWMISYPKSGTTLVQEMVWMIVNDDYETGRNVLRLKRFPHLEGYTLIKEEVWEEAKKSRSGKELEEFLEVASPQWITLEKFTSRRFIKSHLQFPLLPPNLLTSGCKVVYVARNPKDAAVSFFKYRFPNFSDEDFPEFWDYFQNGCVVYGPYWEHVKAAWRQNGNKNFCFLFYEDIVKDMKGTIKKVAAFLDVNMTQDKVDKLADYLNIENFRKIEGISKNLAHYMPNAPTMQQVRKGKVGGWKNYFTDELNSKANDWIEENYKNTDLRFPTDLK